MSDTARYIHDSWQINGFINGCCRLILEPSEHNEPWTGLPLIKSIMDYPLSIIRQDRQISFIPSEWPLRPVCPATKGPLHFHLLDLCCIMLPPIPLYLLTCQWYVMLCLVWVLLFGILPQNIAVTCSILSIIILPFNYFNALFPGVNVNLGFSLPTYFKFIHLGL